MRLKALLLSILFFVGTGCATVAPTPILIGPMVDLNDEVVQLYVDCSVGAQYLATKDTCQPDLLKLKVKELRDLSVHFIEADNTQPHGYDIHLATTMIYFRIGERNLNEYTKAEQIARQFFETQKTHSSHSINNARFYWAWFASAAASKQHFEDRLSLTVERKADLLLALGEGTSILDETSGPRLVRLRQALSLLTFITDSIQ
jgi:hypothetical protein